MVRVRAFAEFVNTDALEQYSEKNLAWLGVPSVARTKGGLAVNLYDVTTGSVTFTVGSMS